MKTTNLITGKTATAAEHAKDIISLVNKAHDQRQMKTPTGHTPGPWQVDTVGDNLWISAQPDTDICAIYHPYPQPGDYDSLTDAQVAAKQEATYQANARLIAAAPELLESLENIAKAYGDTSASERPEYRAVLASVSEAARAAIAKAKGQTDK